MQVLKNSKVLNTENVGSGGVFKCGAGGEIITCKNTLKIKS